MKATTLNPHERKKKNYALRSFLWGIFITAVFVVPSMIRDKGMFIYCGDFNCQVLPFYQLMSDAVKSGNVYWNWYTDLGTPFVGSYSFYNLGSVFFWMMVPFPSKWIPYLMGPMTILKFGCANLTAYIFLQRYAKNKNYAVFASMLYTFSGISVYSMVFHFIDSMVFFPLLLAAMDSFIFEKKRGRFAFAVAICAITNYYFFASEVVFCLIYWIVRMVTKNYRMTLKEFVCLVFEAVAGTAMALFLLLPSAFAVMGNSRVSSAHRTGLAYFLYSESSQYAEFLISLFMPSEYPESEVYVPQFKSNWYSITGYMPLFSMAGVFAIVFNKHKNKWLRVFYAVCGVFTFVPLLNSSFQMFTESNYVRWFFMLMIIMAMGSVIALEDPSTNWKKAIAANFAIVVILILIMGLTPNKEEQDGTTLIKIGLSGAVSLLWLYSGVAMFNIAMLTLFISVYKRNKKLFNRCCSLLVCFTVMVSTAYQFVHCSKNGHNYTNVAEHHLLNGRENIHIDDIEDWRNDAIVSFSYTTVPFDEENVKDLAYDQIEQITKDAMGVIEEQGDVVIYNDNDNISIFWQIPGVECFHSTVAGSIMALTSGFDFDRTTLTNWPLGMYGLRSLFSVKYMFNHEDSSLTFEDEDGNVLLPGWKYYDTQNTFDIYENENVLPMGFSFDNFMSIEDFVSIPTQYKHLAALDVLVLNSEDDFAEYKNAGMQQKTSDDYDFTEKEYFHFIEDRKSMSCYDFSRDNKGFQAAFDNTTDKEKWVFFSVPYDEGWKAYVNENEAEITVADFGLMAVKVPANQTSSIRFDYHIQGMFYGAIVSGIFLVLAIIYIAVMKKKAAAVKTIPENAKSLFDTVKKNEEENMMHVYKRVPVALESGAGSAAYDINHKKYIDFTSGIGVNALGFANGSWSNAVIKQMNQVQHTSNVYYNTTQIQLAEILCMKTGFSKVFFANSGAEANECAIKLARKYGSDKYGESHTHIVTLENSFHGRTITTLAATGQDNFHKHFTPFTEGFGYAKANDMESIKDAVTEDTCAVMIELIQGEGGVNPLDREFVTELSQFCNERDILLIVDEIQTGIGRTGKLFCYENYDIKPDVITSAKALGGGLPLSACLCNEKLQDVMTQGTNGTTFGGNTIACAGAMKILDIVADEQFLEEVAEKGEYMRERIQTMNGVKEVRGMGLMIGIVLEKDNAAQVQEKCAENGLLVLTAKNLVRLLPPLNIDMFDIDEGLDILEDVINNTL